MLLCCGCVDVTTCADAMGITIIIANTIVLMILAIFLMPFIEETGLILQRGASVCNMLVTEWRSVIVATELYVSPERWRHHNDGAILHNRSFREEVD